MGIKERRSALRELLTEAPLFSGLAAAQLDDLVAASRVVDISAQDVLFKAGEAIREAYVLISGSVKRSTTVAGETEKVIELAQSPRLLSLGEVFGGTSYAASCQAITPGVVVAIDARKLRAIVRRDLKLSGRIIQAMAQRQHAIEFDVAGYHHSSTGTQRLLNYLIELAGGQVALAGETTVTLRTNKKNIASRIGTTPESLSRSLRQLSDSGVIVVEGRHVHIQNAALLNTEAGNETQRLTFRRKPKTVEGAPRKHLSPGALVNLCGRPRLLSQRMAVAWGLIGRKIAPAQARVKLRQLTTQFELALTRLGSQELTPALDRCLGVVTDLWPHYRQALLEAEPVIERAAEVLALSEEMLEAVDRLTREADEGSALPAAHYVNVAGRNRMLSQRIGKFFLFRDWGACSDAMLQRLGDSHCEFEINLAKMARSATAVPELAAQLEEVADGWRKFEGLLQPDPTPASSARRAQAALAEGERLLRHLDTTVKLYERLAK